MNLLSLESLVGVVTCLVVVLSRGHTLKLWCSHMLDHVAPEITNSKLMGLGLHLVFQVKLRIELGALLQIILLSSFSSGKEV